MRLRARPEEAIGLECAWPDRRAPGAAAPVQPDKRGGRRWGRWLLAAAAFAALAYLGWRLGLAGWPGLATEFSAPG